jgi:hypothetical protein
MRIMRRERFPERFDRDTAALVPALTAFLAIPLLGEWPSDIGWAAIVLISAGVYLTSGGPLLRRRDGGTIAPSK